MKKIFYTLSTVLLIASILSLAIFRLPFGIDFRGGSLMEIRFLPNEDGEVLTLSRPEVENIFKENQIESINVQTGEEGSLIIRFKDIDEDTHKALLVSLDNASESPVEEERFDSIGPVIGKETARKSIEATIVVLIMIVLYVAWAFRKLSFPIKSWRYGIMALVTLFHDVLITVGIFSIYLYFSGADIGVPFIAAVLTILGYSVNDTIVVFDRVRENLLKFGSRLSFDQAITKSVKESLVRSVNTSATTLLVLLAIFFFGGATIQDFVLVLIIGIVIGTYSSLAIASPLLATWVNFSARKK